MGRRWRLWLAVVLVLAHGGAVQAEETLAEARSEFAAADGLLNALYAQAATELPAEAFEDLRRDQRRWLAGRDPYAAAVARLQGGAAEGAEEDEPWFWLARAERTAARSEVLRGWLVYFRDGRDATGWEGVWVDGDGGTVWVAEVAADRVALQVFVVRGPTFHLGELAGVAERHGRTARFTARFEDEGPPTWLTLVIEGPRLRVFGEHTWPFHGVRAYFDGDYVRVRTLESGERAELLTLADAAP